MIVGGIEASGLLDLAGESLTGLSSQNLILLGVMLLWGSAIASAIIDTIPFTIAMIPIIQALARPIWISRHCGGHWLLGPGLEATGARLDPPPT